ncbi:hypothetical protein C8Q73DRAFT_362168 [Cubamyces lactineus]|nr:hypothetical protein C8Q73DRAFT_362168 [Cubamyces lactineus]
MEPINSPQPFMTQIITEEHRSTFRADLFETVLYDKQDVLIPFQPASRPISSQTRRSPSPPSGALDTGRISDDVYKTIVNALQKNCASELAVIARVARQQAMAPEQFQALRPEDRLEEKDMYKPLETIMRFIEIQLDLIVRKAGGHRTYTRQVITKKDNMVFVQDVVFPKETLAYGKPDFLIADVPRRLSSRDKWLLTDPYPSESIRSKQCPAFIEVKLSPKACPTSHDGVHVKRTLVQGADYARLILANRPHQLYAYGMFICGDIFCVAIHDRCGIVVSPDTRLTDPEGLELFVRIIAGLTWELSPQELGLDPTVTLTPGYTFYEPLPSKFPRFQVNIDQAKFETVGPPLWQSFSLLGRGTSVFYAISLDENIPVILKTAWHTPGRQAEAQVYEDIKDATVRAGIEYPRGMAELLTGGDVKLLVEGTLRPVTVSMLRKSSSLQPPTKDGINDRVLHRVALRTVGKPLWKWSSLLEFASALLDVVKAHKALSAIGILHRDISPGNVLIRVEAKLTEETRLRPRSIELKEPPHDEIGGFLADFEFASIKSEPEHLKMPGDAISGTPMFMSTKLLYASTKKERVSRTVEHDLESLCWTIIYALYARALEDTDQQKDDEMRHALNQEFFLIFSAVSTHKLLRLRRDIFSPAHDTFGSVKALKHYARQLNAHLPPLIDISWEFLRHLQPSNDTRDDADTNSQEYLGLVDQAFPDQVRKVVQVAPSDPQTTAAQTAAYYKIFLKYLSDFVLRLSHSSGPK